ncbi:MAG: prolyl oligopeptidase family serine peptidase, partial [Opitutaceae bacterium]
RKQAGRALLSVGNDEDVRVWLNGKLVLSGEGQSSFVPDVFQVEIDMKAGENCLLVKVPQHAERRVFSLRVLETGTVLPRTVEINPAIVGKTADGFSLVTDMGKALPANRDVTVEVVASGGGIVAAQTVHRGDTVGFDARNWPDGPYEARCTTSTFDGRAFTKHFAWYKGDCLAKARELAATAASADISKPEGATLRMLAELVDDRLGSKLADARGNPWEKIHSALMEYDELMLERQGRQGRIRPHGFVRLAYRDEVDGSTQFCRAYLPAGYDPAKKWPVVIGMHGYNPQNPAYVRWWGADSRHTGADTELPGHQGLIHLEPHGRGNTRYIGMGDSDVIRALAEARRLFNVDEDRVYLTGNSMGGWGTWNIATRHPDLFAAIAPIFGGSDYHAEMPEEQLARLDPLARFFNEKKSSWSMADSLLNIPIFVHHGDVDKSVNVDYSRWGVRLLQRWGYDIRYQEHPGRGHEELFDAGSAAKEMEWFLEHRRNGNPSHVRLRTADLRYASAYWVRIDQMASPLAFAAVDAERIGSNLIRLDTENVLDITLSPSSVLVDVKTPLTVVWNGASMSALLHDGKLRLTAAGYTPAALHKNGRIPGTIQDFTVTPFAVVIGTVSHDPEMAELCRQKADAFIGYWRNWQKQELRVFKDTEISEADMARYSLLLIGGAEANKVAAGLADRLPLKISSDQITIDGKSFAAKDGAVQMVYPNPLNPERYVLIVAGTSTNGMYYCDLLDRDLQGWDYIISDGRIPAYKQKAFGHQVRIVSGMFDANWRFSGSLASEGDSKIREKGRQLLRPKINPNVDTKVFDVYVGRYQIEQGPPLEMVRQDNRLLAKVNGTTMEMLPLTETDFFIKEFGVQLSLIRDDSGKIAGFSGYNSGRDWMLKKVD